MCSPIAECVRRDAGGRAQAEERSCQIRPGVRAIERPIDEDPDRVETHIDGL
jgi:hypothetical protein